jgi:nicotinate-nucleotide--dimethylbenzimidazole phosphoribosyltransferase
LVADVERVRYVATARTDPDDPDWSKRLAAHRARRPATWMTEEVGDDPERLAVLLAEAGEDDVLLVDDLGGWLAATLSQAATGGADALVAAVRECPAERLVLVTPEVGLSVIPMTAAGRDFADAIGTLNRQVAAACESVAFVIAGETTWLRGGPDFPARPEKPFTADATRAWTAPVIVADVPDLQPGLDLPMPDEAASAEAAARLLTLDFAGAGLGTLAAVVRFAAASQGRSDPRPWRTPRTLLLRGDHEGGAAAGYCPADAQRAVDAALDGGGTLAVLASAAGASVQAVDCPPAHAIEVQDALDETVVDAALGLGWALAQSAVDEGADLLILASCGSGAEASAAAIVAVATGGEPAALLDRVVSADGCVDDEAWMRRCMAVRDARHRIRARGRDPKSLLAMLGGGDIAVATGVLLGATARQTPVLIDGPVAVAAGLVARDFGAQTRHWLIMPDHGEHPAVKLGADVLGVEPLMSLKLSLGEGATALAALPLLNTALTLAAATAVRPAPPAPSDDPTDIQAEIQRVLAEPATPDAPMAEPATADAQVAEPAATDSPTAGPVAPDAPTAESATLEPPASSSSSGA